jgi:hypothetical protein
MTRICTSASRDALIRILVGSIIIYEIMIPTMKPIIKDNPDNISGMRWPVINMGAHPDIDAQYPHKLPHNNADPISLCD